MVVVGVGSQRLFSLNPTTVLVVLLLWLGLSGCDDKNKDISCYKKYEKNCETLTGKNYFVHYLSSSLQQWSIF